MSEVVYDAIGEPVEERVTDERLEGEVDTSSHHLGGDHARFALGRTKKAPRPPRDQVARRANDAGGHHLRTVPPRPLPTRGRRKNWGPP
jgi:hypothetical protein